jgi:hypothetical protein
MPEYGVGRYTQLSFVYGTAGLTWWADPEKVEALAAAKKEKKDLGGEKTIKEYRYWRDFK